MIITGLETRLYRVPPARPWEDATHVVGDLEYLVLRLDTDTGEVGWGLAYSVGVGLSAVRAMVDDYCRPTVIGRDVLDTERTWTALWNNLHRTGSGGTNTMAIAAIDIAMWDLIGKMHGVPLHRLLGGAREEIPAYYSGIDSALTPAELAESVVAAVDRGYRIVKVKVGAATERADVARIAAVREAIGDDVRLLLDANQRWHVDEAIGRVRALERFHPGWIEEPLLAEDVGGHARLRRMVGTPIAVGESLYGREQFLEYLRQDAADIFQPDVVRVGGITEWVKIAHLAQAWGVRVAPHYMSELSVHLTCGVSNAMVLEDVSGGGLHEIGIAVEPPVVRDGVGRPPQAPGIGLSFDFEALRRFEAGAGPPPRGVDVYKP